MEQEDIKDCIVRDLEAQLRSTELWVKEWRTHGDAASMRNAAYALGKLSGAYLIASDATVVPKELTDAVNQVGKAWEDLI